MGPSAAQLLRPSAHRLPPVPAASPPWREPRLPPSPGTCPDTGGRVRRCPACVAVMGEAAGESGSQGLPETSAPQDGSRTRCPGL